MFNLPELFAGNADFVARRESWDEGVIVFGLARRIVKNKDVESTLVYDERVRHFIKGADLEIGASLKIWDGKVCRDYFPDHGDMFASDWVLENQTELIANKREKLKEAP